MTLNFNIKIKVGKRTPVSVEVFFNSLSESDKIITFKNNKTLKESEIATWIQIQLFNKLREIEEE